MSTSTDHTQQIPTADGYYQQGAPVPPAPPAPPAGDSFHQPPPPKRERRGVAGTLGVALLAAVLASGGTYAATHVGPTPTATTSSASTTTPNQGTSPTVVQGNATAPDWSAVAKAASPSVVSIDVTTQQGSGAGSGVRRRALSRSAFRASGTWWSGVAVTTSSPKPASSSRTGTASQGVRPRSSGSPSRASASLPTC